MARIWRVILDVRDESEVDHLSQEQVGKTLQRALSTEQMGLLKANVCDMEDYG